MKHLHVKIDSRLRVDVRDIDERDVDRLKAEHEYKNPAHFKLKALKKPTYSEPAVLRTWRGAPGTLILPRGRTQRVREWAKTIGREVWWHDERTAPAPQPGLFPRHRRTLYDYQHEMVEAAIERENCLVRAGTGGGKTTAAMALVTRINVPTLVVVERGLLHEQWRERAYAELGLGDRDVGVIQSGRLRLKPLTIAMQQTLWRMTDDDKKAIASYFGAVVCDEVQKFAASTFLSVIDWLPAKYRIGMSADETRKDKKEFLVYDQFGDVVYEVPQSTLDELGKTIDVEVRAMETGTLASWYRNSSAAESDFNKLLDVLTIDDGRNVLAADIAAGEVHAGRQVLVFSQRRDHCERLCSYLAARGVNAGLMMGGPESAAESKRTKTELTSGRMRCAVGTIQAIGTGIDIPTISRGVLTTPIPANRQLFGQVKGRLGRATAGKTDSILYYLHDGDAFGDYPLRNIRKWTPTVTWQGSTGAIIPIDERLAHHSGHGDQVTLEQMLG